MRCVCWVRKCKDVARLFGYVLLDQREIPGQKHKFGSYPSEDWMHLLKESMRIEKEERSKAPRHFKA